MDWTDDNVATLKSLHDDGNHTAEAIAERLGTTRNAVLGKLFRLGLSKPQSPAVAPRTRRTCALFSRPEFDRPRTAKEPPPARDQTGLYSFEASRTGAAWRQRQAPATEPTKFDLRRMLAQAVQNTAKLNSDS